MKGPLYAIQVNIGAEKMYLSINPNISFVSNKSMATLFKSKVMAYGWMVKGKALHRTYKFAVVTL